jgi:Domain of unknown function (DUF4412)
MKFAIHAAAFFAAAALAVSTSAALAGVIVEEQETINRGGPPITQARTIIIQGNKQKIVSEHDTMITDLDKGVMMLITPSRKTYSEMPFPPKGMGTPSGGMANIKFTKSGGGQTVSGYKCENYNGVSHMMGTRSEIIECFSTSAPGAADFSAFQKEMIRKLKGTKAAAMVEDVPNGVPLASQSTTSMKGLTIPGMSPDQAEKLTKMMANRPPIVTKTTVTKITTKSLPDSDFAPPAGYTKQAPPQMRPPSAGKPPAGGGPAAHSLPE